MCVCVCCQDPDYKTWELFQLPGVGSSDIFLIIPWEDDSKFVVCGYQQNVQLFMYEHCYLWFSRVYN